MATAPRIDRLRLHARGRRASSRTERQDLPPQSPGPAAAGMGHAGAGGGRSLQQSHRVRRVPRPSQAQRRKPAIMPELPEVETVRRGLAPVMEGARFEEVVANRGDLRWPLPKDFARRLQGQTVSGLGRRAKYLLVDMSSGEVLVMHLGMSGSFRIAREERVTTPGAYYHDRSKDTAHDHVVFRMSSGATIRFNDPRRFGSMKLVPRTKLGEEPQLRGLGPEPLGNEFGAAMLAAACRGKNTSLKAAL